MMKYKRLYLRLTEKELSAASVRFHYGDQMAVWYEVYRSLRRCIAPEVYYEYDDTSGNRVTGVISLGSGPDRLMRDYQRDGQFSKALAAECLSMELLSCSYRQFREIVFREKRQFLVQMDFCDQETLITMIPKLKQSCPQLSVSVNRCGALIPSQSVVFFGKTGSQCDLAGGHSCRRCRQSNCTFRDTTGEHYDN